MIHCDFTVSACGPGCERTALANLLRTLPSDTLSDESGEMVVSLEMILPIESKTPENERQYYFWAYSGFVNERTNELRFTGWMRDAPPLLLIAQLSRLFPSLECDCVSKTNHERLELWRASPGFRVCTLIESLLVDPKDGKHLEYFLREGETPLLRLPG